MMLAIVPRIASAVGSSIATVAVFDTKAESRHVMRPKVMTVRTVLLPTPGMASMRNAKRRATPWRSIAWARMNAPMKTKMVDEPNGAITSSTGATPISTISAMPSRPPIGIGTASVIHSTMTNSSAAASFCWLLVHVERQQQEDQEDRGRQEQPDRAPRLLEALLLRAQLLLAERPVRADLGEALQRVAVRLSLPRCHARRVPRVRRL